MIYSVTYRVDCMHEMSDGHNAGDLRKKFRQNMNGSERFQNGSRCTSKPLPLRFKRAHVYLEPFLQLLALTHPLVNLI